LLYLSLLLLVMFCAGSSRIVVWSMSWVPLSGQVRIDAHTRLDRRQIVSRLRIILVVRRRVQ